MTWVDRALEPSREIDWNSQGPFLRSGAAATEGPGIATAIGSAAQLLQRYHVPWRNRVQWAGGLIRRRGRTFQNTERALFRTREAQLKQRFPDIYAAIMKSWAMGGMVYEGQFSQLLEVAELVDRTRPETVLELGSGVSSTLYARMIGDEKRFVTVEESPHWHSLLQRYLEPYAGQATSLRIDRVLTERDGEAVVHYAIDHSRPFDFVYVDGPSNLVAELPEAQRQRALELDPKGLLPNIDIELMWERGVFPKVIVIDGRRSTLSRLMRKSDGRYQVFLRSAYAYQATGAMPDYDLHHSVLLLR